MKKTLKIALTIVNALTRSIYFIAAIAVIFLVSYFLGYSYLSSVKGSDSMYHLSNIIWFNKFFPSIPYWYPLQNGGVIPIWGYPQLSYFIIIIIHKISGLSLVSLYQLFGFLSVPLTALGLYLFVWTRLKNQTMALIGAIFYILMPISWVWLFDWGFYTESTSYIFIFPTLIFYDIFFKSYLNGKIRWRERLSFLFTIIFLALVFLAHPGSFFATLAIIIVYSFIVIVFKEKKPRKIIKGLLSPIIIIICTLLFLSFIILDFRDYAKKTSPSSGPVSYTKEQMQQKKENAMYFLTTPVDVVLGFTKLPPTDFKSAHNNIVVPQTVWLPAIAGGIVSIIYSPIVLALALIAAFPLLIFWQPEIGWIITRLNVPFSGYFFHHRMLVLYLKLTIPIVGAFGTWAIFRFLLDLPTFWIKKGKIFTFKNLSIAFISSILSLLVAVFLIINFANKPVSLLQNTEVRYGPKVFDLRDPFSQKGVGSDACQTMQESDPNRPKACDFLFVKQNLEVQQFISECSKTETKEKPEACELISKGEITQDQFKKFLKDCQKGKYNSLCLLVKNVDTKQLKNYLINKENWPEVQPANNFDIPKTRFSDFIALHNDEKMLRIDVSPYLGGVVQTLNLESEISQINLYAITLSLLGPYWGYEQQVFFSKNRGDTINVNNLAKWFGIKYLFLEDKLDPIQKYKSDAENWKLVDKAGVWQFAKASEMYSWTVRKPALLVIGSKVKRAFEPFFRVSVNGGFSYEDGWLVQGKENVDDYSLDELKKFDTLVLFGYSYKNKGKAHKLLDKYVRDGGNLFISSGWQYVDKDWEIKKAPEFFPVEDLVWSKEYGKDSYYLMEDKEIGSNIDVSRFSPLVWSNQAWGISIPSIGKREWARTILSVDGKPLVAGGKYGNGKVIWSGINWPGHISTYDFNKEEMKFFNNMLRYLSQTGLEDEKLQTQKLRAIRDYPDKVTFIFNDATTNDSTLYWRESQFENWHAKLINIKGEIKNIKIYKAGPGFMLMRLPPIDSKSKLLLEFSTGLRTLFGKIISVLTLLSLLLYVIFGEKLFKLLINSISFKLKNSLPKTKRSMFRWLNTSEEEEKY